LLFKNCAGKLEPERNARWIARPGIRLLWVGALVALPLISGCSFQIVRPHMVNLSIDAGDGLEECEVEWSSEEVQDEIMDVLRDRMDGVFEYLEGSGLMEENKEW
jgi:hypothetical protein